MSTTKRGKGYFASNDVGYRCPAAFPPPRGVKLILLTSGGQAVIGDWRDDSNYVAWSPLLKKIIRTR